MSRERFQSTDEDIDWGTLETDIAMDRLRARNAVVDKLFELGAMAIGNSGDVIVNWIEPDDQVYCTLASINLAGGKQYYSLSSHAQFMPKLAARVSFEAISLDVKALDGPAALLVDQDQLQEAVYQRLSEGLMLVMDAQQSASRG